MEFNRLLAFLAQTNAAECARLARSCVEYNPERAVHMQRRAAANSKKARMALGLEAS